MTMDLDELQRLMDAKEGEHLEFKQAKSRYSRDKLAKYCAALANEGGGAIILGVTDRRPRRVVGTQAFPQPEDQRRVLCESLHLDVDFEDVAHPNGRVLVFRVSGRPIGSAVKYRGVYWMRKGDTLVPMSESRLREIFAESGHDFSADICEKASIQDLDPQAIEDFRQRWIRKSGNPALANLPRPQLLSDAEALVDGRPTYASMVLFGTRQALGRHLAQAEVVFEYRASGASGPAQQRDEFRRGFFGVYERLWEVVNLRNNVQHYQEGLFLVDIPTFDERSVREAILNAVSHRDYQRAGSVFIRQYPRRLVVESPGGLPLGVTTENILDKISPRNRRIAEMFAKCGLGERAGLGMDLMFEESIRHGKAVPDLAGTDDYQVVLTLDGSVQDPRFVRFLEMVGQERTASFTTGHFLVLHLVRTGKPVPERLRPNLDELVQLRVLETVGKGRGSRKILSRRLYGFLGTPGTYTRTRGLERETNKQLLLRHVQSSGQDGTPMREFLQVLPDLSRGQVKVLVRELASEERIQLRGRGRGARWYPSEPSGRYQE